MSIILIDSILSSDTVYVVLLYLISAKVQSRKFKETITHTMYQQKHKKIKKNPCILHMGELVDGTCSFIRLFLNYISAVAHFFRLAILKLDFCTCFFLTWRLRESGQAKKNAIEKTYICTCTFCITLIRLHLYK